MYDVLRSLSEGEKILKYNDKANKLFDKLKDGKIGSNFLQLSKDFQEILSGYRDCLFNKLDPSPIDVNGVKEVALLSTFIALLSRKKEDLNNKNLIITSWTNLGKITKKILECFFEQTDNIECFALQLKSPQQYFSYAFVDDAKRIEQAQDYKDWQDYLLSNIKYASKAKPIYRYFASINDIEEIRRLYKVDTVSIKEALSLKSEDIRDKMQIEFIEYSGKSYSDEIKNITELFPLINIYHPEASKEDLLTLKNNAKSKNNLSLANVLNKVIHSEGKCFIREFDLNDYKNLLVDYEFQTGKKGKGSNKLFDYIAFRDKDKPADWLFCLESLYDEDLDLAYIRVFFKDDEDEGNNESKNYEWKSCLDCSERASGSENSCKAKCGLKTERITNRKLKLNRIFFGDERVTSLPFGNKKIDENHQLVRISNGENETAIVQETRNPKLIGELDLENKVYHWNKGKVIIPIAEYKPKD
jgi:hypothetical protein